MSKELSRTASPTWCAEFIRAAVIVAASVTFGLSLNALSPQPLVLLDPNGPGSLPPEAPRIEHELYLSELLKGRLLPIDARADRLLAEGRPLGSMRAQPETLMQDYPTLKPFLDTAASIVVICDSADCSTADRMVQRLQELGYKNTKVFSGGWVTYKKQGLPLETEALHGSDVKAP